VLQREEKIVDCFEKAGKGRAEKTSSLSLFWEAAHRVREPQGMSHERSNLNSIVDGRESAIRTGIEKCVETRQRKFMCLAKTHAPI
jgi:hypothetical protein